MRKNILILGHNYATQFIDIYNQYTKLFDKNKFTVTIAYLTGEPNEEVRKRTLATDVLFLNFPKRDIRTLKIKAIRKLLSICREKNFQLVICHRYKPTYIMLCAAQFHKIPALIFVMHELRTMSAFARQLLLTVLFRNNMLLAGVSDAVRDDMRKNLRKVPKERIITLYNMIDIEMTEPELLTRENARRALNLSDDSFVFGNIARLAVNKDHTSLIKAFSLIKPQCTKAKLIIIGAGELEASLKEKVKDLKLNNDVIFTGFLPNAFRYMKAFDCFVLSSIQEAFGRVLLEAMLAKRPIIATKVNGIPEVMGEIGRIIQPKTPEACANAMREIYTLSQEERDSIGEKAYERAKSNFSIPKFYEQFWQLPFIQAIKEPL